VVRIRHHEERVLPFRIGRPAHRGGTPPCPRRERAYYDRVTDELSAGKWVAVVERHFDVGGGQPTEVGNLRGDGGGASCGAGGRRRGNVRAAHRQVWQERRGLLVELLIPGVVALPPLVVVADRKVLAHSALDDAAGRPGGGHFLPVRAGENQQLSGRVINAFV